ncbi:MAG TPA: hypothetical protein PLY86_16470 [bacterium]|nr:hypothetical protein [bacterium]
MDRDRIREYLQLDEGPAETRAELKRIYNKIFGDGAYAKIVVPEDVAKGADIWNGYEWMSASEYYRFTRAKKKLASLVGTRTHYATGVIAKAKEYLNRKSK